MSPGSLLVLVIEDDATHRKVVERQLEARGHQALVVSCAKSGLLILADPSRRAPDVILMDMVLGQESGLAAIADLASSCSAPIVMMSGHFDEDFQKDAILVGAKAAVGKPLDFEALDALMRKLAAGP